MFENSDFIISEPAMENINLDFMGVKDGENISEVVKVVLTPEHTIDHASLFIETNPLQHSEIGSIDDNYKNCESKNCCF